MKLVSQITLGLLLLSQASANFCVCDKGQYWDSDTWTCKDPATPSDNCLSYAKEGSCVANPDAPANCKKYEWNNNEVQCDDCEEGHYRNGDGQCIANPNDEGCSHWNGAGGCKRCANTHFFDETVDPTKCVVLPEGFQTVEGCSSYRKSTGQTEIKCGNCIEYQYGDKDIGQCTECPFKYDPDNNNNSGGVVGYGMLLVILFALLI